MILGIRLQAIADMVDSARVLADIGSDHAYLPICLLKGGRIERAIVTDLSQGPLQVARNNIINAGFDEVCSLRQGDGLTPLSPGEAEVIVIAGMGGNMIIKILSENPHIAKAAEYLVLQPMQQKRELRQFLNNNSYKILSERVVREDGKYYEIIKAKEGSQQAFTNIELEIGFAMLRDSTYRCYIDNRKSEWKHIIDERSKAQQPVDSSDIEQLIRDVEKLK